MTVRECLEFSARLKLPGSDEEKTQRVEHLIDDLKLNKCQHTKIGGPLIKGISGGERKRTSIGVELITNPSLIFLDEPTTGLDSHTATSVMKILRDLANQGRTVVQTIHQPNTDIFESFDRLMLLAQGKIIYYNDKEKSIDYFGSIGFPCPNLTNPADYFMSIMSIESIEGEDIDADDKKALERSHSMIQVTYDQRIDTFHQSYQKSELKNDPNEVHPEAKALSAESLASNTWGYEFSLLAKRNALNQWRLPHQTTIKFGSAIIISLITIILYQGLEGNKEGVQNRMGALFFLSMNTGFGGLNNVSLIFPSERPVFLREVNNNMYRVSTYFWAKLFTEFPPSVLLPTMQIAIVYFAIGLNTNDWYQFFVCVVSGILCYNAFTGLGYMIGTGIHNQQVAVVLTPLLIVPMMLFAGFFVNQDNIPGWLVWLKEITIFKYCYQAMVLNEFTDLKLECMEATANPEDYCDPLGDYDSPQSLEYSLVAMAIIWFVAYFISFFIMKSQSKKFE
mmetsp:Transcript_2454/g.3750  ORF Transcript_2454/g.3750 Transcript_2454/m.3750 type:complete len:507 (-) Transcript_2454:27-1547(-)